MTVRGLALGCAAVLCCAVTTGCGNGNGGSTARAEASTTAPQDPERSPTPAPPEPPKPRGPVLKVDFAEFPYTVQVVEAKVTPEDPHGIVLPPGETFIQLLLVVRGMPKDRPILPPYNRDMSVHYPSCTPYKTCIDLDAGSDYFTGEHVATGAEPDDKGLASMTGAHLEAGVPYYTWVWSAMEEGTSLEEAKLCATGTAEHCIPLGKVEGQR